MSFCEAEERPYLKDIQKLIGQSITVVEDHPFVDDGEADEVKNPVAPAKPKKSNYNRYRKRPSNKNTSGSSQKRKNNHNRKP